MYSKFKWQQFGFDLILSPFKNANTQNKWKI